MRTLTRSVFSFGACLLLSGMAWQGAASAAPVNDWQMLYEGDQTPGTANSVYLTRQSTAAPVTQFTEGGSVGISAATNGEYTLNTLGTNGTHYFSLPADQSPDFDPTSTTGYTFEARVKLLGKSTVGNDAAAYFAFNEAGDASKYWSLSLYESSLGTYQARSGGMSMEIDNTSFHTYRITVKDSTLTYYVDGKLIGTSSSFSNVGSASLDFGDLTGSNDGGMTVDYIRMNDTGAFAPVPEPASFALLTLGGLVLAGQRRRRS